VGGLAVVDLDVAHGEVVTGAGLQSDRGDGYFFLFFRVSDSAGSSGS
jgi:hypothetical protein